MNPKYAFETFVVGPFNAATHFIRTMVKPGIAYNPLFIYGKTGRSENTSFKQWATKLSSQEKRFFM
ncbi:MAG: DnaA/Hda family protein [Candidatus Paceibacterota bacterium]